MKSLKRICIYFIVTFAIVSVCGFTGIIIKEADKGIFHDLATKEALDLCVQLGLAAFTALIPYSVSIAAFLTFWAMNDEKRTGFFRALASGLVLVVPLSVMTYYYDWSVRPGIMAASSIKKLEMETNYPKSLMDKYGTDIEDFVKKFPMAMDKKTFTFRTDSLKTSLQADADTCGQLLSILPDTMALKAYESYRLKDIGVALQYSAHPTADKDSLMYILHTELYQRTLCAWDTLIEQQRYHKELFNRSFNTAYIYIAYLLFAFIGYMLRHKPIKKILGGFAILIVAAYLYQNINTMVQAHTEKVNRMSKEIEQEIYKGIKEMIEKERNIDDN